MSAINYSIIIPHKNIPTLLQRCLDSIPFKDGIQIIIVDDNSDPTIVDFDNFPGMERADVEIYYTTESKGAGYARNVGLSHAKGEWLMFIDSDDFLLPDAFDTIQKNLDAAYDIIYFLVDSVDSDTLMHAERHLDKDEAVNAYSSTPSRLDKYLRYQYTEPWGKIIKKRLVDSYNIRFDESLVANDYNFSVKTGYYADKIKLSFDRFYCITVRKGSLCNKMSDSEMKIISRLHVYNDVQKFFINHKIHLYPFYSYVFGFFRTDRNIYRLIRSECKIMGYNNVLLLVRSALYVIGSKLSVK